MKTLIAPHKTEKKHLEMVIAKMRILGIPKIKAVNCGEGVYVALEGSHRIEAASLLGVVPEIEEVEYSDEPCDTDLDCPVSYVVDTRHTGIIFNF